MTNLLAINVNDHTEKKNGLTYLSWAWAWAKVLEIDAGATWEAHEFNGLPVVYMKDESAMVKTSVTISGSTKSCWLPVMDHRNKAIKNPDAYAINTAIVRCLTKAIGMHGLGLYIYAGEDLPQSEPEESPEDKALREEWEKRVPELDELTLHLIDCHKAGKDLDAVKVWYTPDTWSKDDSKKNAEVTYVWVNLKEYSKLRSAIKANKP